MLLVLVSLLCCVPAAKACLQCDRRIRLLLEDFVLSAPTVNNQIEMKKICDHAYVTYRETSWERKGVIGEIKTWFSMKQHGMSVEYADNLPTTAYISYLVSSFTSFLFFFNSVRQL